MHLKTDVLRPGVLLLMSALTLDVSAQAFDVDGQAPNCLILPDEVVEVSGAVPGVIEEVLVKRGDVVRAGQVLARLEASVERAVTELADARASASAELRLRQVELGYDVQHRDRLIELQQRRVASSQSLEDAQRVAEAARWQLRLAEERRREAALSKRRADAVLALKTVRAPIDGVVVSRHRSAGEHVDSDAIVRIARLDPLRVEVLTPVDMFGKVKPGMRMHVRTELAPEERHSASVVAVDPVADPGSGMFAVELSLPNPDRRLPAGVKCFGELIDEPATPVQSDSVPTVADASLVDVPSKPPASAH